MTAATVPAGAPYTLVLTHDVDRLAWRGLGPRDREFWALVRALSFGALARFVSGHLGPAGWLSSLWLLARLPLVCAGLLPDPLAASIERICRLEARFGFRSTFYFLPFPYRSGRRPDGTPAPAARAGRYDISRHGGLLRRLETGGWEVGLHGIDCHVSAAAARDELAALCRALGRRVAPGVRMHWLYSTPELRRHLAAAGFAYDTTLGSNDAIGFPENHDRPYRDLDSGLPVVPLAMQDVTLLRRDHLNLRPAAAWQAIDRMLVAARRRRAVVTVLWHNDSFLPPRGWHGLYRRLLARARRDRAAVLRARDVIPLMPARRAAA